MASIPFDNSYARDLPDAFVRWQPVAVSAPRLLFFNPALARDLGLDDVALGGDEGARVFGGNEVPVGAEPIAQAYAGHQFGGFSPRLGDGRAVLLGEVVDPRGHRHDIALKGSGRTPFSRGGDGRAAVGPMLREAVISEAMHALGIPTTRALAVVATGEPVIRERVLPGAVLTRVAASHLRVGTFQYFAARGETDPLRRLADYTIARHYPDLVDSPDRYHALLAAVARRQASLIAQWMNVGFIHGVMNTDNMALSGETIDYGPCAFLEAYDPATVFSSIDQQGRYAYGQQPGIARWNLARFAETLLPLMAEGDDEPALRAAAERAMEVIHAFPHWYDDALRAGQRAKLGLDEVAPVPIGEPAIDAMTAATEAVAESAETETETETEAEAEADTVASLADGFLALLQEHRIDFTLGWRELATAAAGDEGPLRALFPAASAGGTTPDRWLERWRARCAAIDAAGGPGPTERARRMRAVNPRIIPRNHQVEAALDAASDDDDLEPFRALLGAVRAPFGDDPATARFAEPARPEVTANFRTFCGT